VDWSPAFSGALVFDWIGSLFSRLGLSPTSISSMPEGPQSQDQRLASGMDPDGVAGYGDPAYSQPSEVEEASIGG
jgi:hypothetical protein